MLRREEAKEAAFVCERELPPPEVDEYDAIKEAPRQPAVAAVLNETLPPSLIVK